MKRADARLIKMELPEAEKIAKDEVIFMLGEEERIRVRKEYERALKEFDTRFEKDHQEKEEDSRSKAVKKAAWTLSLAIKRWQSRKKLRLLCEQTFEKEFDEKYQAFFYRNKRTVTDLLSLSSAS